MKKKIVLFISTNDIWGGSEVLWTQAAIRLSANYSIKAAALYDLSLLSACITDEKSFFDLKRRFNYPNPILRMLQWAGLGKFPPIDRLFHFVKDKPALAIISQGNNTIGFAYMQFLHDHHIPFVTLTQLVTMSSWPGLNEERIQRMTRLYDSSRANFFVSKQNLTLHEQLLKGEIANNKIVFNPFTKTIPPGISFPDNTDGMYKIALVGRLEIFHKGYDLLFEVLKNDKWRNRPIQFSIFASGPHLQTLERWKEEAKIDNISIKQHIENVADIWKEHHLLLMPSRMEGQSLSLIEAMKFKRPSIVTRVGGVDELVEEGNSGFIASYPTPYHLDEAMERAWDKRADWKSMGETAFHFINERHPSDEVYYLINQLSPFL